MRNSSREPSLLEEVGALAGMYTNIFRLMEKRAAGHTLIVKYEPPETVKEPPKAEVPVVKRRREHARSSN